MNNKDHKFNVDTILCIVLKDLIDNGFKWIAKDGNGDVFAYVNKPIRINTINCWGSLDECMLIKTEVHAFECVFSFLKWTDEEPCNIIKLLEDVDSNG